MRNPTEEAAEVLAAARTALGEFVEEGVDRIPATAEAAKPAVESPTLEAVRAELGECIRCGLSEGEPRSSSETEIPTRTCSSSERGPASRKIYAECPSWAAPASC